MGFTHDHPPLVFSAFFWGSAIISALVFVTGFQELGRLDPAGWLLPKVFLFVSAAALPMSGVLWLLMPWRQDVPPLRKAATVAFLATSLLLMLAGGIAALLIVSVAVGNALVVFGLRGGLGYAAVAGLFPFGIGLLNPEQSFVAAIVNGAAVLLLCLVILVVVVAMIESERRAEVTRRLLADLEQAHAELRRYAAQTRELAIAEERTRIARDMHDSVGHYLTVINVSLANAQRYRTARPEAAWDEVRQAQELTLEALTDTRRWVRALKPLRMKGRTGVAALRALAESFGSADTDVAFTVRGTWPDVDESRELVCYRIVQEGLTNALRHSRARNIVVALDCTPERVELTVSDDGAGAERDSITTGFGLRGLRERLESVNGALDVSSDPGEGFTLRAMVPA
ncbi:sensor histidine kinase [Nonomuraea harbinensis]|uniref:histidine kinase n=1 Tax=Nonomuraea harbinensis TaxID=1286938 RepID=A0ABW1BS61_9ACTN|nr:sensor histidine kinase [Nonomuraea harbinensis]